VAGARFEGVAEEEQEGFAEHGLVCCRAGGPRKAGDRDRQTLTGVAGSADWGGQPGEARRRPAARGHSPGRAGAGAEGGEGRRQGSFGVGAAGDTLAGGHEEAARGGVEGARDDRFETNVPALEPGRS
jgi:hypothetical protein